MRLIKAGLPRCGRDHIRVSRSERPPYRRDDTILRRLVEIGVHRQADDFTGEFVGKIEPAFRDRMVPVGTL
jgi:hypothetical protein